jgi:hypothetical protein
MTPLRRAAAQFVIAAGYYEAEWRILENPLASKAKNPAYSIYVRALGAKRGKCIGAILLRSIYPI